MAEQMESSGVGYREGYFSSLQKKMLYRSDQQDLYEEFKKDELSSNVRAQLIIEGERGKPSLYQFSYFRGGKSESSRRSGSSASSQASRASQPGRFREARERKKAFLNKMIDKESWIEPSGWSARMAFKLRGSKKGDMKVVSIPKYISVTSYASPHERFGKRNQVQTFIKFRDVTPRPYPNTNEEQCFDYMGVLKKLLEITGPTQYGLGITFSDKGYKYTVYLAHPDKPDTNWFTSVEGILGVPFSASNTMRARRSILPNRRSYRGRYFDQGPYLYQAYTPVYRGRSRRGRPRGRGLRGGHPQYNRPPMRRGR